MATTNTSNEKSSSKCPPPVRLQLAGPSGMRVGYRQTLHGRVSDPKLRVQVLVHSADGQWYLQKDAVVRRNGTFTVDTHFGYADSFGHTFTVVATAGHTTPSSPVTEPPPDPVVKSRKLKVRRYAKP